MTDKVKTYFMLELLMKVLETSKLTGLHPRSILVDKIKHVFLILLVGLILGGCKYDFNSLIQTPIRKNTKLEVVINVGTNQTLGSCNFSSTNNPTSATGFNYRVTFNKAIDPSTFSTTDIVNSGTGGATTLSWMLDNCGDNTNFKLTAATIVGDGTIIPNIAAESVLDNTGMKNLISSSTNNSMLFDSAIPSVTINQAITETVGSCSFTNVSDPTNTAGFSYRINFSKAINASTLTAADITNSGTGGATALTWSIANCGDNTNFKLTALAINGSGTIIPNLLAIPIAI